MTAAGRRDRRYDDDDDSLGTVLIVLLYATVWSSARSDAIAWVSEDATAQMVAWKVVSVLVWSWAWMILLVAVFYLVQTYVITGLRPLEEEGSGRGRTVLRISLGPLVSSTVLASLFACVVATYLFAWAAAARALDAARRKRRFDKDKQQTLRDLVSNAMTFNLVIVVVTLLLGARWRGRAATPASSSRTRPPRGRD